MSTGYRDAFYDSQHVWTVDCRTGKTGRKFSATDAPEDRPADAPTDSEIRAEGVRRG